jgi:Tol biopolymer transport system component
VAAFSGDYDDADPPRHLGDRANGNADEHYVTATRSGSLIIAAVRPDSRNLGDMYEVPFAAGAYGEPRNLGPAVNAPETHETTPWVSPDGSYIIFASRGRADSQGDMDLYVTKRDASGAWGAPINLGPTINSAAVDYCPLVSPDGKYLYFSSTRGFLEAPPSRPTAQQLREQLSSPGNGLGDTWRVPMTEVRRVAGIAR